MFSSSVLQRRVFRQMGLSRARRLSASVPPVATRRYRLTAVGGAMLALMAVVGYGAINSGTNLVYYLFSLLVAAYLTHGIVSPRNLDRLHVRRRLPRKYVAGSELPITLELTNGRRWLPAQSLIIEDYARRAHESGEAGSTICSRLAPRSTATIAYCSASPLFQQRGIVEFREIVIRSLFPFGFIERSLHIPAPAELLVLPTIYPIREPLSEFFEELDGISRPKKGMSGDLYGLREYVAGEPAKRIHWRTSARARRIMVTEFEREEHPSLLLYLPTHLPHPTADDYQIFEVAVVLTASLAAYFLQHHFEVGLLTHDGVIAPASGDAQIERIQRALALVQLRTESQHAGLASEVAGADAIMLRYNSATRGPNGLHLIKEINVWDWRLIGNEWRRVAAS